MTRRKNIPFQNMSSIQWQNLALAALFLFYLIQVGFDLLWRNTCGHLAIDYCAFLSAGQVANAGEFADIYNLELLRQVQFLMMPLSTVKADFAVTPVPYLPFFLLPFQLFSLLPLSPSFAIWTILNLAVLFFYLHFFIRRMTGQEPKTRLLVFLFLCLPVYWNLFNGQVNLWLVICVGEFMRAVKNDRLFLAGAWLGGLLLKPQLLVLIVVILLLQRSLKLLAGLAVSSGAFLGISFFLLGRAGLQKLVGLWLGYSSGLPTNDVEIMMNWRMVGLHLGNVLSPQVGWGVTGLGMAATLLVVIYIWRKPLDVNSTNFVVALLGLLAATGLFAWHSHIHTMMMLIPPLTYLLVQKKIPQKIFIPWMFVPSAIYVAAFLSAALIQAGVLPANLGGLLDFLRGASGFGANILLLAWTIKSMPV